MTLQATLTEAIRTLTPSSPTPDVDALYLLCHVLNTNSAWIFLHADTELNPQQNAQFQEFIARRVQGTPIAYLLKMRGFWSLDFYVNEHVLIPRPETELLVELALHNIDKENAEIADLGTGSGAIALSLAHERPLWQIDATDISEEALKVARHNAQNLELKNIHFYKGSWCQALPKNNYDLLISNPPYLSQDDPHRLEGDLRFEPQHALVSGLSGLEAYEIIIKEARLYLNDSGLLMLEHGYTQREAIFKLLAENHYHNIKAINDYAGHPRVLIASKPMLSAPIQT